jgi:hypothetical protein
VEERLLLAHQAIASRKEACAYFSGAWTSGPHRG